MKHISFENTLSYIIIIIIHIIIIIIGVHTLD